MSTFVEEMKVQPNSPSYRAIATQGVFWNIAMAGANKIFTLAGQVVLAWILVPEDMGKAGMATAMAGFALFLGASSVGDVLVQRGRYKEEIGQAFWVSLAMSIMTASLIAILSPFASFIGRPYVSKMLLILALLPLFDFLSPTLTSALKTSLEFKRLAFAQFVAGITYTTSAVILALLGFGAYSLIIPVIPRSLAVSMVMIQKTGFPNVDKPDLSKIKTYIKPSLSMSLTSFLTGLQTQAPVFCVGLIMNAGATGHFSWGWMVAGQTVFLLSVNLRQVLMPVIAKMNGEPNRQASAALRSARAITAVLMTVCCFQALLAEPVINLYFPEKWHAAGPVVVWISIGLAFQGIYISAVSWLNGIGKYRELIVLSVVPVFLTSGLAYLGCLYIGITGAAVGSCLGLAISSAIGLLYLPKVVLLNQGKNLFFPATITLFIFFIIYFLMPQNNNLFFEILGAFFYVSISIGVWRHWSEEGLKELLRKIFDKLKILNVDDSSVSEIKPNFFIIGAPKCGTTALSEYLKDHPNIFMSSPKEPEYFSFDLSGEIKMGLRTYLSIFKKADKKRHAAIGEASTAYLYSKRAVEEILKFNPDSKFIVILRNPIEMVQSLHSQMLFQGIETVEEFETAWKLQPERSLGRKIPFFCFDKNSLLYSEWAKLGDQMERLLAQVPKKSVEIIMFEDFVKNPELTYSQVVKFLGLIPDGRNLFPKVNERKYLIFPTLQPFIGLPVKIAKATRSLFGWPKDLEIFLRLLSLNGRKSGGKKLNPRFKNELIDFYKTDIDKLSKILGANLDSWIK